jgi:site-specific DNA-cytosine methylase
MTTVADLFAGGGGFSTGIAEAWFLDLLTDGRICR